MFDFDISMCITCWFLKLDIWVHGMFMHFDVFTLTKSMVMVTSTFHIVICHLKCWDPHVWFHGLCHARCCNLVLAHSFTNTHQVHITMCHPYLATGTLTSAQTHRLSRWVCSKQVGEFAILMYYGSSNATLCLFVCWFVCCVLCVCLSFGVGFFAFLCPLPSLFTFHLWRDGAFGPHMFFWHGIMVVTMVYVNTMCIKHSSLRFLNVQNI